VASLYGIIKNLTDKMNENEWMHGFHFNLFIIECFSFKHAIIHSFDDYKLFDSDSSRLLR
ncbi:MAG: hypothetical protein Q8K40_07075, partial [Ignavibacteria bacterium]|nr:hypothetical protein [Ignavibacteria bacterium]